MIITLHASYPLKWMLKLFAYNNNVPHLVLLSLTTKNPIFTTKCTLLFYNEKIMGFPPILFGFSFLLVILCIILQLNQLI
jgi:hypothetical protein